MESSFMLPRSMCQVSCYFWLRVTGIFSQG